MDFEQQLQSVESINIFVGVHGAGLTHLLFLPQNSSIIEIMIPSKASNDAYLQLSTWVGHKYIKINAKEAFHQTAVVNEQSLKNAVKDAIKYYLNKV